MQIFISSIESHTKNLDVLMILNIKKVDKNIISTVTTTATVKSTTTPTISSTITKTTQENTNKSEYAFKKSLNSLLSSNEDGINFKHERPVKASKTYRLLLIVQQKLQPLLLQSINESEQQSGIVSDIILIVSDNTTNCNSATKSNIDCKTSVVVEKGQQAFVLSQAKQNYALIERWSAEAAGAYPIEIAAQNGNSTHFNHLIRSMMNDNDTVNMICDSIDYLITVNTNHSIVIDGFSSLICNDQNLVFKGNNYEAMADNANDANTSEQAKRTSKLVSTYINFDDLLRMTECEKSVNRAGIKPRMRLCGGGEDSINNGTNAWGVPGSSNPGSSWGTVNPQHPGAWGNNPQVGPPASSANLKQQPPQPPGSAGAGSAPGGLPAVENPEPNAWAGGNPVNPNSNNAQNQSSSANNATNNSTNANANSAPQPAQVPQGDTPAAQPNPKLERLNTMIEALHALDGWGSENVNQDSRWDVPASPEPGSKPDPNSATSGPHAGIPMWKTNTGTEIWEANLRNGGQMPQQAPVQKTPWGPSTNLGGTWGEDDDTNEPGSVWNGASGMNQPAVSTPNGPPQQPPWNAGNMWGPGAVAPGSIKKENEWGGAAGPAGGWDQRNVPPLGAPSAMDSNREIRGDPRGISGRLNGNVNLWEQHQLPGMAPNKIPQVTTPSTPGAGPQWPTGQPPVHNKMPPSGWDDASTPGVRRNVDDGTALWGQGNLSRQNSNVSNWKDGPENIQRNSQQRNSIVAGNLPGPAGNRLGNTGPIKPDNLWGQNNAGGRGGSGWEEPAGNNWEDKNTGSLWNDNASANWNKTKQMGANWNDPSSDMGSEWGMHNNVMNKPPNKMNPLEIIRSSKHYRMLCEMGFKKDEVETVLRICNMNLEESIEMLQRNGSSGDWRRQDDHGPGFGGQFGDRFSSGGNTAMPFPQANQNPLSGFGGNPNMNSFNNMKFGAGHGGPNGAANGPFGQPPSALNQNAQSQPSTQQLRMLVQQIQMAVQHGYLNHQILNQPLAPQTLLLLNQMLNHIKQLQVMQSNLNRSGGGGANAVQISLAINKLKSQIGNLQNQITAQQTIYMKQQQQQNNPNAVPGAGHPANDLFRTPSDLSGLPGTFSDMSLKDNGNPFPSSTGSTSQQSRLNQWKLPAPSAVDKDSDLTDFPRAPGTSSKPTGLGVMDDGTWSNGRSNTGDGWPDSNVHDKDWAGNADAFTDLVPEFEPGKPWKGTQATRIEDDPTITPGSVARSPLSIAAAKESNLFANSNSNNNINNNNTNSKSSPTESISSSTWSYNPSNNHGGFGGSKLSKNPWPDSIVPPADLWDNSLVKGRVAPPGLKTTGSKLDSNGWSSHSAAGSATAGWNSGSATWSSTWILLKNLSPQIDGPTLRTLCIQHGPLLAFHLYLNHGIALCKYSTREEANKAQMALNNCMLGSTTICAETPTEGDVQNILQHLGPPSGSNGLTGGQSGGQNWRLGAAAQSQSVRTPADTWGSAWPSTGAGSNLWGPLDGPSDRGTPANLNSYLPESLLGTDLN
ncbi:protein Gawky-like isoform X2 [Armigeres subalbatus]|uniref:protein Gawky-like isoform X2 n=1 Tax=Armigeres subalbatus TaxID=124917 RepID=UPI002ED294E0